MKQVASTKAYKGIGMEGFTAKWYASMTARGMEEFKALATRVAAELPGGGDVLEVAPGPGYFAIELAKLGDYCISGVDISHTMIEIARENAKQAGVDVDSGSATRRICRSKTRRSISWSAAPPSRTSPNPCERCRRCTAC